MNSDFHDTNWNDEELDNSLAEELETVRTALSKSRHRSIYEAPTNELLARYLDNSLEVEEHRRLEKVLADMPGQLERLIWIYRETKEVLNPEACEPIVDKHFLGESVDYEAAKVLRDLAVENAPLEVEGDALDESKSLPPTASENG